MWVAIVIICLLAIICLLLLLIGNVLYTILEELVDQGRAVESAGIVRAVTAALHPTVRPKAGTNPRG